MLLLLLFFAFTSGLGLCKGCLQRAFDGRLLVSIINEGAHETHQIVQLNSTQKCSKKHIKFEGPAHHLLTEYLLCYFIMIFNGCENKKVDLWFMRYVR